MATWPVSLPQKVRFEGFVQTAGANVKRTPMDRGEAKQRPRGGTPDRFDVTMILTTAQRATFLNFYITDLENGALSFTWIHPVTFASTTMRIVAGGYRLADASGLWLLAMSIEELA